MACTEMAQFDVLVTNEPMELVYKDDRRTYMRIQNKGIHPVEIRFNDLLNPGFPLQPNGVYEPTVVTTEAIYGVSTEAGQTSVLNIVLGIA